MWFCVTLAFVWAFQALCTCKQIFPNSNCLKGWNLIYSDGGEYFNEVKVSSAQLAMWVFRFSIIKVQVCHGLLKQPQRPSKSRAPLKRGFLPSLASPEAPTLCGIGLAVYQ